MHSVFRALKIFAFASLALAVAVPAQHAGAQRIMEEAPPVAGETDRDFAAGRIIVKVSDSAPPGRLAEINRNNDARVEERLPEVQASVVDLPRDLPVEEAVDRYDSARGIEYAEPDYKVYPQAITPDDEYFDYLYGLDNTGENPGQNTGVANADINAPEAWERTTGSSRGVIAVVDTGVQIDHPDLRDNIWTNTDEIPGNGKDDDGNGYVDDVNGWDFYNGDRTVYDNASADDHGTHVAGTIAAEGDNGIGVSGVNWQARIMPLKFLDSGGGFTSDAVRAIDYAVDNGASVSNHSWGGSGYSRTLQESIERAGAEGHLIVAAAGNESANNDSAPSYPASYENSNVISVAATNNRDELAGFSNYGAKSVDLAAPGARIVSTLPGGYGYMSGTSMAAPHVTGSAALLAAAEPGIEASEIKRLLLDTASGKSSLENRTLTGGRLDVARALNSTRRETSLQARPSRGIILSGSEVAVSGTLSFGNGEPLANRRVVLQRRLSGQSGFKNVSATRTSGTGQLRFGGLEPPRNAVYRVRFGGDSGAFASSDSAEVKVRVRIGVNVVRASEPVKLGKSRKLYGAVSPVRSGEAVYVIQRGDSTVARKEVTVKDGRHELIYRPPRTGNYSVSVLYPRQSEHYLGKRSPEKSFKVVR